MSQNDSSRAVTCTLTPAEEAERSSEVRALLVDHYAGYEEADDGLHIRFDGADAALVAVSQFIADELQCCSFAEYEVTVAPPYEETILTVTGPDGTREMFLAGLVDRLEAESA